MAKPVDYRELTRSIRETSTLILRTLAAVPALPETLTQLSALNAAVDIATRTLTALRDARDALLVTAAAEGEYGFRRIGEAAGVSASYASRIAREAGVRPRHVRETPPPPKMGVRSPEEERGERPASHHTPGAHHARPVPPPAVPASDRARVPAVVD